jgi:transcriptional regulator with XRE-family HTH domain
MGTRIHPIDRLVGQRVRFLRVERKMSQTTLASSVGLTFQQLQKYESGTNRISASKLVQFAKTLGVNVASLFDWVDDSDTAKTRESQKLISASQLDLSIASDLSKIPAGPMKRKLRALVSALVAISGRP